MKFYYIDDTFFKNSSFLIRMRERLLTLCEKNDVAVIFVSGADVVCGQFEDFINECSKKNIQIICSPAHFDVKGVRGVLTTSSLKLDDFDSMRAYSGSVVSYDTQTHMCERIYLEFFSNYQKDFVGEEVIHEIEEILSEVIMKHKKQNRYN